MTRHLRLGTRRSALATTQSRWVSDRLGEVGASAELVEVVTEGDVNKAPLTQIGGTGVFASALRQELLAGKVDIAVHSLKDLPVAPEPGLVIAAVPAREDVRDVLVSRDNLSLDALPAGSRIGTGSPRRAAQLRRIRPDVELVPIRGNVGTRIGYVDSGELDAVILAGAGLHRLGLTDRVSQYIPIDQVLPAAGQGALAVECRSDDTEVRELLARIDDPDTRLCVEAERAMLATLEAGCTAPIGAFAEILSGEHAARVLGAAVPASDAAREGAQHAETCLLLDAFVGTGGEPDASGGPGGMRVSRAVPLSEAADLGVELGLDLRKLVGAGDFAADSTKT